MFAKMLYLNSMCAKFGTKSLSFEDLSGLLCILSPASDPAADTSSWCSGMFAITGDTPRSEGGKSRVYYDTTSGIYGIELPPGLSENQRAYFLALEIGNAYLHNSSLYSVIRREASWALQKGTKDRGTKLTSVMHWESVYFALCCIVPQKGIRQLQENYAGLSDELFRTRLYYAFESVLPDDVGISPEEMINLRWTGHQIFTLFLEPTN